VGKSKQKKFMLGRVIEKKKSRKAEVKKKIASGWIALSGLQTVPA